MGDEPDVPTVAGDVAVNRALGVRASRVDVFLHDYEPLGIPEFGVGLDSYLRPNIVNLHDFLCCVLAR